MAPLFTEPRSEQLLRGVCSLRNILEIVAPNSNSP